MITFSESDKYFMKSALNIANRVKGKTFPNPAVGAVIVKDGKIIGKGGTEKYGGMHAEKKALHKAGEKARGATLYVSLEPCGYHGKTSPCTNSIIDSGIKRVVVAVKDLNPLVNGKGIRFLRDKDISVSVGCLCEQASELNEDFFWSITLKRPWISVKLALTLDGRIADINGESKWITGQSARNFVHDLRRRHAAVGVGIETIKKDNPKLTVRHVKGQSPARIVFTSNPDITKESYFRENAHTVKSIIVCRGGKKREIQVLTDGINLWYTGEKDYSAMLEVFLEMAYQDNLTSILIEGGQKLVSCFIENRLVNRLYLFYGNRLLGEGLNGISFSEGLSIDKCIKLTNIKRLIFDEDFMITGFPEWSD